MSLDLTWEEMRGPWRVRDLWARADAGVITGQIARTLPAHGSALLLLSPENRRP